MQKIIVQQSKQIMELQNENKEIKDKLEKSLSKQAESMIYQSVEKQLRLKLDSEFKQKEIELNQMISTKLKIGQENLQKEKEII